ncbi:unnamed protein product [Phytophthora lilii]|uniref:Unnamed protein product n=1 Tax=Phytophthora lilii TaxID=2077276 RepID=A0A9W6TPQ0_9STRA|nr:unnamed protein product [Phytophthora lilii]
MKILETLDTSPNPKALCVLSPHDNGHLAFPSGASPGEIVLYDANNLSVLNAFQAHPESSATGSFGHFTPITSTLAVAGSTFGTAVFGSAAAPPSPIASTVLGSSPGKPSIHQAQGGVSASSRSTRTSSSSTVSNFDEVAGVMSAYLPSSFSGIAEGTRDFAYVRDVISLCLWSMEMVLTMPCSNG